MVARGAKNVFQVIVGARKINHIIAMKEPRPIAPCHFEEGGSHLVERGSQRGSVLHLFKQFPILSLEFF